MKIFHVPFASILLVLTLSGLAILYFGFGFYLFSLNNLKEQNLPLSIAGGVFLSMGIIGILFKLMYWPGADMMLVIPLPLILMFFLLPFFFFKNSDIRRYYHRMQIRTGVVGLLCLVLYFTPNSTLLALQHWDNPELARLKAKAYDNPDNQQYKLELQEYLQSHQ